MEGAAPSIEQGRVGAEANLPHLHDEPADQDAPGAD